MVHQLLPLHPQALQVILFKTQLPVLNTCNLHHYQQEVSVDINLLQVYQVTERKI